MYIVQTYAAYLLISIALTVWVARTLHKNGRVFLIESFGGQATLADSVNQLLVVGFDRAAAPALGARPLVAELALLALVAATIVVAVQALGNLLVLALLVGPASIARLVSRRLPAMMGIATLAALLGGIAGLYLSYYAGTAGGASIAAAIVAIYVATFLVVRVRESAAR